MQELPTVTDDEHTSPSAEQPPRCFVSYSHDSPAHKEAVLALVQALRSFNIDAHLDQFVQHSPPRYWPAWMVEQVEDSDYVLVVITETYARRFKQRDEPGKGKGAIWEGAVITSQMYHSFGGRTKFIPILFEGATDTDIPFPLSETNYHKIVGLSETDLRDLLHQLKNIPLVVPVPLGSALKQSDSPDPSDDPVLIAVSSADADDDAAIAKLTALSNSSNPETAAHAAFELGELLYKTSQYNRALEAYQFVLEYGPRSRFYEQAKREMVNVLTVLSAHFGENSAVAAVYSFISLIQSGNIDEAWQRIDRDMRLTLAQAWVIANEHHPDLAGREREELAESLAELDSRDPLSKGFLLTTLREFRQAFGAVDINDWGAAEKVRRYNVEYEMVILMPTKGEVLIWEHNMELPTAIFIMRRKLQTWLVAGTNDKIARPGWPPTFEQFPADGVEIRPPNDPKTRDLTNGYDE